MKILFFSHYFPPEGNAPASRTYEHCKRWVQDGHEVTVITCAPNMPTGIVYEGYRNRLRSHETVDGIEVIRVWTFLAANKGTLLRSLNYLSYMVSAVIFSLFRKRPDMVIGTSPQLFCGWAALVVSKLRRAPFILEIRDLWPESIQAVSAIDSRPMLRALQWLEVRLYASATHIVTVGEGYRQRLLAKHVPDPAISVVSNGVNCELFKPRSKDAAIISTHGLRGKFVCSYIGTIGMACALDVVVRAARELKEQGLEDIVFLLVGDGAVREELEAETERDRLDNVVFAGFQQKERIPAFLATSDVCLIHLKKTDLFTSVIPSKIFEAAGMARPIIMGVEGHSADLVRDAQMGVCMEPENATELVGALKTLSQAPLLAETLGKAGHDYIVKHFNRDSLAHEYLAIIEAVYQERTVRV